MIIVHVNPNKVGRILIYFRSLKKCQLMFYHFTLALQEISNQIILNEAPKFNDNDTFKRASQSMFKIFFYDLAMNNY
jgi:hypothetical protein